MGTGQQANRQADMDKHQRDGSTQTRRDIIYPLIGGVIAVILLWEFWGLTHPERQPSFIPIFQKVIYLAAMAVMKKRMYLVVGAIAAAVPAGIGLAQTADSSKAVTAPTSAPESARSGAHQVMAPSDVLNALIGEPERHFHQAMSLFASGDNRGAAAEIRSGAALLSLEAGREETHNRGGLQSAAADLNTLAAKIEHGDVSSRTGLDQAFARADLALAAHYRGMADEALANQQHNAAGRWLKAAADAVDDATGWAGQMPPTAQVEARDQIHALEAKIRNGTDWSYAEAKKSVGYLGSQIQYLGGQMQKLGGAGANGATGQ